MNCCESFIEDLLKVSIAPEDELFFEELGEVLGIISNAVVGLDYLLTLRECASNESARRKMVDGRVFREVEKDAFIFFDIVDRLAITPARSLD